MALGMVQDMHFDTQSPPNRGSRLAWQARWAEWMEKLLPTLGSDGLHE